jgi:hypothetical protein
MNNSQIDRDKPEVSIPDLIAALRRKARMYTRVRDGGKNETEILLTAAADALESVTAPNPFDESPHMAAKYWAELVRARKRIAELEAAAAVTAPTAALPIPATGEVEWGLSNPDALSFPKPHFVGPEQNVRWNQRRGHPSIEIVSRTVTEWEVSS